MINDSSPTDRRLQTKKLSKTLIEEVSRIDRIRTDQRKRSISKKSWWGKRSYAEIPPGNKVILYGKKRLTRQERHSEKSALNTRTLRKRDQWHKNKLQKTWPFGSLFRVYFLLSAYWNKLFSSSTCRASWRKFNRVGFIFHSLCPSLLYHLLISLVGVFSFFLNWLKERTGG